MCAGPDITVFDVTVFEVTVFDVTVFDVTGEGGSRRGWLKLQLRTAEEAGRQMVRGHRERDANDNRPR
ncbi:hypothetical protein SAMN04487913_12038 [Arthrobacter sp. ok362]|nr:hypothetical protein SAMN04487913_12038 [Arthrobacter sp. ok362]